MPGATTGGVPYALPADPLVQWPATSQSVAEAVDGRVKKSGDTMTGPLSLPAAPPTDPTHAVSKSYSDQLDGIAKAGSPADTDWNSLDTPGVWPYLMFGGQPNGPGGGGYYYVQSYFYVSTAPTANRTQVAIPYHLGDGIYYRDYYDGNGWSSWRKLRPTDSGEASATTDEFGNATLTPVAGLRLTSAQLVSPDPFTVTIVDPAAWRIRVFDTAGAGAIHKACNVAWIAG
jgi:hypothetical protein